MVNYEPIRVVEYLRDGLVEQEHSGFIMHFSKGKFMEQGDSKGYPFYLRSCAKPLQASLLVDYELDSFYDMTQKEIALCCASHAGEPCHTETVQVFLKKINVEEKFFKCGLHKPLSKIEQNKLLLNNEKENVFQNNCSGKHMMMLALCKKNGWDFNNYDDNNHPLQVAIKNKIYELCEINKKFPQGFPITKDGCGVPICSMPLKNMLKGYANLFFDTKYEKIKKAFIQYPYLIGGENRLDTALMTANNNLIAKVGAGGLCIVLNLEKEEGLLVKLLDCDMKARAITLIEALSQLNWLDKEMLKHELIQAQNNRDILTLHGEKIGEINCCFEIK